MKKFIKLSESSSSIYLSSQLESNKPNISVQGISSGIYRLHIRSSTHASSQTIHIIN